jgi:hypothetical protein
MFRLLGVRTLCKSRLVVQALGRQRKDVQNEAVKHSLWDMRYGLVALSGVHVA